MAQKVSKTASKSSWSSQDIVHDGKKKTKETSPKTLSMKNIVNREENRPPVKTGPNPHPAKEEAPKAVKKAPTIVSKEQIVRRVARSERFPQKHVKIILDEALYQIQQNLRKGHEVRFMEFGKFKLKQVKGGFVSHIQTRQRIAYGPSVGVTFRPSGVLKEKVNVKKKVA